MREDRAQDGIDLFERASAVHPTESDPWLYRARALAQLGRVHEATLVLDEGRKKAIPPAALDAAYNQITTMGTLR
jgi:hypothetical protein